MVARRECLPNYKSVVVMLQDTEHKEAITAHLKCHLLHDCFPAPGQQNNRVFVDDSYYLMLSEKTLLCVGP